MYRRRGLSITRFRFSRGMSRRCPRLVLLRSPGHPEASGLCAGTETGAGGVRADAAQLRCRACGKRKVRTTRRDGSGRRHALS